jgi:hypothetical protein
MSDPWKADLPIREDNIINESERSVDPADDEYKLVKLESGGRLSASFIPGTPLAVYDLTESGTWTKPDFGSWALVLTWGSGGGGAGYRVNADTIRAHGGAGGALISVLIPLPLITSTVSYIIGEGGNGGNSTSDGSTQNGQDGGTTSFGDFIEVDGGNGGLANPSNNTSQAGNDTHTSDLGFVTQQVLTGGRSGTVNTGSGQVAQDAPNQPYQGAGAGGAQRNSFTSAFSSGNGGENLFLGFLGGNGDAQNSTPATGSAGQTTCGGGAAVTRTGASATVGKGGDGFIRIYII